MYFSPVPTVSFWAASNQSPGQPNALALPRVKGAEQCRDADQRPVDFRVNDAQLISRVIAGDRLAGRELYDAHAPRVYSLVFRLSGDEEKARELTQDTFIRAVSRLTQFRGDAAL